mgnify:CR=1 FL=1
MSIEIEVGDDQVVIVINEQLEVNDDADECYVLSWAILLCVKYFMAGYPMGTHDLKKMLNAILTVKGPVN